MEIRLDLLLLIHLPVDLTGACTRTIYVYYFHQLKEVVILNKLLGLIKKQNKTILFFSPYSSLYFVIISFFSREPCLQLKGLHCLINMDDADGLSELSNV